MTEFVEPRIKFRASAESLAGTIYGVVTAMAVIAALADADANVYFMSSVAIGTSIALALTFVYSHWLAGSYSTSDKGHGGGRVAWAFELPTIIGPVILSVIMILIKLGGAKSYEAAEATMWVGVVILFVLGFRIAQHGGRTRWSALKFAVLDSAIGASLVLAKVIVH